MREPEDARHAAADVRRQILRADERLDLAVDREGQQGSEGRVVLAYECQHGAIENLRLFPVRRVTGLGHDD